MHAKIHSKCTPMICHYIQTNINTISTFCHLIIHTLQKFYSACQLLNTQETTQIQQIIGCFLYYARALDNTLLVALNTISQTQANSTTTTTTTTTTTKLCDHLLKYCATKPNVGLRHHASNMTLNVHSDAAFLVAPQAKSRIAGSFFLQTPLHTTI